MNSRIINYILISPYSEINIGRLPLVVKPQPSETVTATDIGSLQALCAGTPRMSQVAGTKLFGHAGALLISFTPRLE